MGKVLSFIFLSVLVVLFTLSSDTKADSLPCDKWSPTGSLANIPVYADCRVTGGDIAVATPNGIFYCPAVAQKLDSYYPGISHFYYVHEYGHYVMGSDELSTDCWAAKQLAGTCYIPIAIKHFSDRGDEFHPRYGRMKDRAAVIARCSSN
jgi:hypothetical protein